MKNLESNKVLIIASDHNGVDEKSELKSYLRKRGFIVIDLGPFDNDRSVDYNLYASSLSKSLIDSEVRGGILICGTGVGMSIVANRYEGVRAVLAHNLTSSINGKDHNNSNVICFGSWINSVDEIKMFLGAWLDTDWGEGRHTKRVNMIDKNNTGLVLANGVFENLTKSHIELLRFAKAQGEYLIVAIDSDEYIKSKLGRDALVNEDDRKNIIQSIEYVDEVLIYNSKEELIEIYYIQNISTVVKGSIWSEKQIRENDKIPENVKIKLFNIEDIL
ncbi:RpiB/LacA/LacB family sugar-phosphate isomerase [Alphaproteobacteria bacterium]|nr:RpiB/LacA/LacB family sugar-phosphate isomerase [Alphaproteobacteria bacterium]